VRLRVLAEAEVELRSAMLHYESHQAGLGRDFHQRVDEGMMAISRDHLQFPLYEGFRKNKDFRRALVDRFPYVIVFKLLEAEILVVAVAHASQRPGYWRRRLD
jgi:toxin ParE1/3/4